MDEPTKKDPNERLIDWTGERYVPWVNLSTPEIHYEHLHRYYFAAQFVKGKTVLDLASGEGYGCSILGRTAGRVIGVEIDEKTVLHACHRYSTPNVDFIKGSITQIPISEEKGFDVITCFEAIEHIEEHQLMLLEVKRLLKDDGLFIISSPNKLLYSDLSGHDNPYHIKELYFDELRSLLGQYFSHLYFLGQRVYTGSRIWPLGVGHGTYTDFCVRKAGNEFVPVNAEDKAPMYFIAIATSLPLAEVSFFSDLTDVSGEMIKCFILAVQQKDQLLRQCQHYVNNMHLQMKILDQQLNELHQQKQLLEAELRQLRTGG